MNLKQILMDLGNKLVIDCGYNPAYHPTRSTKPIDNFTRWLNDCPDAQRILAEMGIEWPVVEKKDVIRKDLGWGNDDTTMYARINECTKAGHDVGSADLGTTKGRGYNTLSFCNTCGYQFHTDSSD